MPPLTSKIFPLLTTRERKNTILAVKTLFHSYFPHRGCFREVVTAVRLIYVLQTRTEERSLDESESEWQTE